MLIRVKYPDGTYDMVKEFRLDHLIETKAIHSFRRSDAWVVLGIDPVRKSHNPAHYLGQERRGNSHHFTEPHPKEREVTCMSIRSC